MKSITSVYKIGNGPSSSHTVGPYHAAQTFGSRYPHADSYEVTLFGSLAFTGEGHGTGKAIQTALPNSKIVFDRVTPEKDLPHPNTMLFKAFKDGDEIASTRIFSIGGGSIRIENEISEEDREVYPQKNFTEIVALCNQEKISILQLIYVLEGYTLRERLKTIWDAMQESVERGLTAVGVLPGGLNLTRKAKFLYEKRCYPAGIWTNGLTGEVRELTDGKWFEEHCDYLSIPLWVRENSLITTLPGAELSDEDYRDRLEVRVYELKGKATAEIFASGENQCTVTVCRETDGITGSIVGDDITGTVRIRFVNCLLQQAVGARMHYEGEDTILTVCGRGQFRSVRDRGAFPGLANGAFRVRSDK